MPDSSSSVSTLRATAEKSSEPRAGFRGDVQGLRAIAVLAVVLFHAGLPIPGGFVGVDIFFVISGFVITAMLMREWMTTGRIRLPTFYIRRFLRLTPALAVVVFFAVAASLVILSPLGAQQVVGQTGLGAMLLSANFVIAQNTGGYFDVAAELNPLLNLWSLSVEEQFYLVFPALLIVAWTITRRVKGMRAIAFVGIFVLAGISFGLATISSHGVLIPHVPDSLFGFYGPGGRVWEFAVGALIALVAHRIVIRSRSLAAVIGVAGLALIGAALLVINGDTPFPGLLTLLPVAGTALLLVAGTCDGNAVSAALASRPMRWIGDRSYSFYLWHWPFISLSIALWPGGVAVKMIAAALSLVPAALSFHYVEARFRRFRPASPWGLARIVAVVVIPALLLPTVLWSAAENGFWSPAVRAFQRTADLHLLDTSLCDRGIPVPDLEQGQCVFNRAGTERPIYLVGDSNAGHFIEAVTDAGTALDSPIVAATTNGCPFVDGYVHLAGVPDPNDQAQCERYRLGTIDYLRSAPPGVVVISQIASYWSDPGTLIGANEASASSDTKAKLDYYAKRLPVIVDELRAAGHEVLIVQQVPEFPQYQPQSCSFFELLAAACVATISRDDAEHQSTEVQKIIESTSSGHGAHSLQLRDEFCGADSCSTSTNGAFNYRDSDHISVAASHALASRFEKAIRPLL